MKIIQASKYGCKRSKIFGNIQVSMALFLSYIHQGDDLFSVQSRGKQCAFMSLSALLTAQNIPLIDWSKTTFINNVFIFNTTRRQNVLASSE
jgi:hypothetical protein